MTFATRTFQGMQQASVQSGSANVSDIRTSGTASASASFNADGSISYTGNSTGGPTAWNSPAGGSPGASTWLSWTTTGNTGTGGSTILSSGKSFSYSCPLNGTFVIGTITCKFYGDSGLTQLLGTITLSVDVESSNR